MPSNKSGKYHYTQLKTVTCSSNRYHNVYGVVRKYHEQGVFIRDETYDSIKVDFSATFDAILPHIKPGNIIRIHRLMTTDSKQYRCIKVGDVLLFSSFKDKDAATYKVRFEAKEPTIELSDFARVAELERWLAGKLLEVSLRTITLTNWYDLVGQVVDIKDLASHRVILIIYDGTSPSLKFNWSAPGGEQWDGYTLDKLICVTAWDRHTDKARKLQKGSCVAFFNLQAVGNKLQPGVFELHLRGGTHHGKRIRQIHPNSFLGVSFKSRMSQLEAKTRANQPKKPTTVIEEIVGQSESTINPSHSTQLLNDVESMEDIFNVSDIGSSISEESELASPKNQQQMLTKPGVPAASSVPAKKMKLSYNVKFPVIVDFVEPDSLIGVKEYLASNTNERSSIKAKVISYKPATRNIIESIKLVCPNCNYQESPSKSAINLIKKSSGPRTTFPCPDCQKESETHYLNATFWVYLYLKDVESYEIPVTLSKFDLIKLLGVRVIPVLNSVEEANKILDFLSFICPTITSEDEFTSDQNCSPYLKWIIQRQPGGPRVKWEYRVVTVFNLDNN